MISGSILEKESSDLYMRMKWYLCNRERVEVYLFGLFWINYFMEHNCKFYPPYMYAVMCMYALWLWQSAQLSDKAILLWLWRRGVLRFASPHFASARVISNHTIKGIENRRAAYVDTKIYFYSNIKNSWVSCIFKQFFLLLLLSDQIFIDGTSTKPSFIINGSLLELNWVQRKCDLKKNRK